MAISTVNLSVLFCLQIEKSLNNRKIIAMQMFLHLHSEHKNYLLANKNFSPERTTDQKQTFI